MVKSIKHMSESDQKVLRYIAKKFGLKTTAELLKYVTHLVDMVGKQSRQEVYGGIERNWSVDLAPESEAMLNKAEPPHPAA